MRAIAYVFAICWGVVGAVLLAPIAIEKMEKLNAGEWASWVQAIGSITALGVAIFVMSRQNKHAAKLIVDADRLAIRRRASAVHALVQQAQEQATSVWADSKKPVPTDFQSLIKRGHDFQAATGVIEEIRTAISTIPVYELGSYKMAKSVHKLGEYLTAYALTLSLLIANPQNAAAQEVVDLLDKIMREINEAVVLFEDGMNTIE